MGSTRIGRSVELIAELDLNGLVERVGDDINRDLSRLLRGIDRAAVAEFRTRCRYTFATRDESRRRWPTRFEDSLHVEVQRPGRGRREFRIIGWSDHPVANVLNDGRQQSSYAIPSSKAHGLLVWSADNVSAVTASNRVVRRAPVTWTGSGEGMEGYHLIDEALEFAAAKALRLPVAAGAPRSKRSGTKRRAPTTTSPRARSRRT